MKLFPNCYGCGVCALVCPAHIISINLNEDGFYTPTIINANECNDCGLCLSVCPYNDEKLSVTNTDDPDCYAAWHNDGNVRKHCSSGGIGFALGEHLIKQGYKAIGVRYNAELSRAEHFLANTVDEFIPSIGSKYIPSYTLPGFSQINRKDKFFITGTPCQIDALRRYIRKMQIENNFVLMDFFCHGVPSMLMWHRYLQLATKKVGQVSTVSWRNKTTGWHNSFTMKINGKNGSYNSAMRDGDLFYRFFFGHMCLLNACYYHCKYKMLSSAADIRIGDLWAKTYEDNQEGVSAVLAFTEKGKRIVKELSNCTIIKLSPNVVLEGQMKAGAKKSTSYSYVRRALKTDKALSKIARFARVIDITFNIHKKIYSRLKRGI